MPDWIEYGSAVAGGYWSPASSCLTRQAALGQKSPVSGSVQPASVLQHGLELAEAIQLDASTKSAAIRMALLLSIRKLAIVLKSGIKRPVSHINSTLRWAFRSRRRLD